MRYQFTLRILQVEGQVEGEFVKTLPSQMDVISNTDAEFTVEISKEDRDVKWLRYTILLSDFFYHYGYTKVTL